MFEKIKGKLKKNSCKGRKFHQIINYFKKSSINLRTEKDMKLKMQQLDLTADKIQKKKVHKLDGNSVENIHSEADWKSNGKFKKRIQDLVKTSNTDVIEFQKRTE